MYQTCGEGARDEPSVQPDPRVGLALLLIALEPDQMGELSEGSRGRGDGRGGQVRVGVRGEIGRQQTRQATGRRRHGRGDLRPLEAGHSVIAEVVRAARSTPHGSWLLRGGGAR
jgi:hypothetical protein